jgi:flagellar biogenesis protein FliO
VGTSQDLWLLLRGLLALAAVLALAVVTLRFAVPWLLRARGGDRPRQIRVEEYYPLDHRNRLYVVRWAGSRFLLGSSPEGVRLLAREEEDREPASATGERGGAA